MGKIYIDGELRDETPTEEAERLASFEQQPEYVWYRISKMTPWLRMTDEEAVIMRGVMDAAPVRLQEIYKAAPYLQSNDDLWPTLYQMIASTLSPARADELLAPEDIT